MKKYNILTIISKYDQYVRKNRKERREKTQIKKENNSLEAARKKMSYSEGMKLLGGHISRALLKSLAEKE